jgi:hypothetical protein
MLAKSRTKWHVQICLFAVLVLACSAAAAQNSSKRPISISVDASHAPQRILHAQLRIPVSPGPLSLYYPKWLPADHSPDGPISNLAGLEFSVGGKELGLPAIRTGARH